MKGSETTKLKVVVFPKGEPETVMVCVPVWVWPPEEVDGTEMVKVDAQVLLGEQDVGEKLAENCNEPLAERETF